MLYGRKGICMLLTVGMLLSVMVISTGAAYQDQDQIKHREAVEKLTSLNIIGDSDNGKFNPKAFVTRAELCKMICYIYTGGKDFSGDSEFQLPVKPSFTDIKEHWAETYIEYCHSLRMIDGMGDGTFAPNSNLTGAQATKLLLAVLGYDTGYEGMIGPDWILNTTVVGEKHKLSYGISSFDPSAALTRERAAQMISNALDQRMINYEFIINAPKPPLGVMVKASIPVQGFHTLKEVYFDKVGNPNDIGAAFERGENYSFHAYTGTLMDIYQGKKASSGKTFLVVPLTTRALVDADKTAKVMLENFKLFIAIPGEVARQSFLPKASWNQTMMPESFTLEPKESVTYDLVFEVPVGSSNSTLVFIQDANGVTLVDYGVTIHIAN